MRFLQTYFYGVHFMPLLEAFFSYSNIIFSLPSSHTAFGSGFWKFVQFHFSTFTNWDKTLSKAISLNILLLCALHAAFGSVFLVWKLPFFYCIIVRLGYLNVFNSDFCTPKLGIFLDSNRFRKRFFSPSISSICQKWVSARLFLLTTFVINSHFA